VKNHPDERESGLVDAVEVLADILGFDSADLRGMAAEWGSGCGDSWDALRSCHVVHYLNEEIGGRVVLHEGAADSVVRLVMESRERLRPIFTMAAMAGESGRFALVTTAPLECHHVPLNDGALVLRALVLTVDKPENHGFGYHLHPLDSTGRHLGYKLLFDAEKTQDWLSWESHGQGARPWGSPSSAVLSRATAESLYLAAGRSVRGSIIAPKGMRFPVWARAFERPGKTAFVAHPLVGAPTRWPQAG
jgi:hypothetical protein